MLLQNKLERLSLEHHLIRETDLLYEEVKFGYLNS